MATGTAPVMPTRGAEAATTKKTIPRTPRRPFFREVSSAVCAVDIIDLLIEFIYIIVRIETIF
jgi:hypothetical protein